MRKSKEDTLLLCCYDNNIERKIFFKKALALLAKVKERWLIDSFGQKEKISWWRFLLVEVPRFGIEILLSIPMVVYSLLKLDKLRRSKSKKSKVDFCPLELSRIAYLRTDHWFGVRAGGSVGHISGVANGFHKLGYDIFFVSTDKLALIDETKTPIHVVKPSRLFRNIPEIPEIAYNNKFVKEARKVFTNKKPDAIYQRDSFNNYTGILLSREFNIPLILEYNGPLIWVAKYWGRGLKFKKVAELIEEIKLKYADLIVVVSKALKDELIARNVDERKILVNPNCVDAERYSPDIDGNEIRKKYNIESKIVIGFIGTFGPWHGVDVLAKAIKPVTERYKDVHFLIIGDGGLMGDVRSTIEEDGVTAFATLTGLIPQEEAPKYLAACDIFVSPHVPNPDGTPFFGSPTKLFEFMAMGKGIVASNLEQLGEVLEHGRTAWLVKPGDVSDLADGIIKLVEDENLRKSLGENARTEVMEKYTWERNVEKVIERLRELGLKAVNGFL